MEAKKYVKLTYHSLPTMSQATKKMEEATDDTSNDYLDGIVLARDRIVICAGRLTNDLPDGAHLQQFTRAQDPWFYIHAERRLAHATAPVVDFITLVDYLFRYDRGAFWVGKYTFNYFITHSTVSPATSSTGSSVPVSCTMLSIRPVIRNDTLSKMLQCHIKPPMNFCNGCTITWASIPCGCVPFESAADWLIPPTRHFVQQNRKLEQQVQELQGKKWLYAHAYYTEDEFWTIYDRNEYDALRAKYHATYLPNLYDKGKVDIDAEEKAGRTPLTVWLSALFWSIWPLSGLYGVYKAWKGGESAIISSRRKRTQVIGGPKRNE
jgi:hypothetical protein